MQIIKGSKDRRPEINPFAGEQSTAEQTIINLDKYVTDAKAYKQSYEAQRTADPIKDWTDSRWAVVNTFINRYPPEFARESFPEATKIVEDRFYWDADILFTTTGIDNKWSQFMLKVNQAVLRYLDWDGIQDPKAVIDSFLDNLNNNIPNE